MGCWRFSQLCRAALGPRKAHPSKLALSAFSESLWETTNRNSATEEGGELGNYQALHKKHGSPVISDRRDQGKPQGETKKQLIGMVGFCLIYLGFF